ncbi:N-acetylmuramoyl-L-alanine amidase family protein [Paenibacillus sp. N1-5-1-14]|uniref:N-acetylmuramoyl-L-alanine amidase family protein n=1 Tax=Paenibacillus radicibacter TaxID=2972488 RepID=UPI0021593849|nr:N-acetylmuramoyl-L-alanine amidase family protein [Paenibacillus radicibacter]MCR8641694.1 N-acetylmuramoyl-L-alanine amidase family protein [Paenibacillus radicibacter]
MKLWKVLLSVCLFSLLLPTLSALGATANPTIHLVLNGVELKPLVQPRFVNDYTIVPIRVISEGLGAKIGFDQKQQKVTITKDKTKIELFINKKEALVNGEKKQLDLTPVLEKDTTLVPLRFVGEQFNVKFRYDPDTTTVLMDSKEEDKNPTPTPPPKPEKPTKPDENGSTDKETKPDKKPDTNNLTVSQIETTETSFAIKTDSDQSKPKVMELQNPHRLVFDIENAVLGKELLTKVEKTEGKIDSKHPLISQIRYSQFSNDPATVRVTLDLTATAKYRLIPSVKGSTEIRAEIYTTTIGEKKDKYIIVLDAGHGAHDPGASATSANGRTEKEFTLAMVKKLGALLEKEAKLQVLYTRSDDTFVELDDRVSFANNYGADLFLSIHGNSFTSKSRGTETYYYNPNSLDFASVIHQYAVDATGFIDRKVQKSGFRVIKGTTMPAALLEVGFLSNKEEADMMYQEVFQNKLANSLVKGIKEYLNLK